MDGKSVACAFQSGYFSDETSLGETFTIPPQIRIPLGMKVFSGMSHNSMGNGLAAEDDGYDVTQLQRGEGRG
jgi:hypothetical protein